MEIFKDERIINLIKLIRETIKNTSFENKVYICGGTIRNSLLGLPINDIDICVSVQNGGMLFSTFLAMRHKCYVAKTNPVIFETSKASKLSLYTIDEFKDLEIECCGIKGSTLEEDANTRDLTINSLYFDISNCKLCDPTNCGLSDLASNTLRCPSKNINGLYRTNPIKMLRTIRFSTILKYGIEKETWFGIIKNARYISQVPKAAINGEIEKILLCETPSFGIKKLYFSGMLDFIIKDISDLTRVMESANPSVTMFDHTMAVLDATQPYIESRLAALFHDVGSIVTSKIRSAMPESFSADVASSDLKDLCFSKDVISSVIKAIKYHDAFKMYGDDTVPPDKKLRKFVNLCGDDIGTVVDLMNSNNTQRTKNKKKKQVLNIINRIEELEKEEENANIKLPINGKDIMKELKIKPSPTIGVILNEIKEAYFENPGITKEECMEIAKKMFKSLTV